MLRRRRAAQINRQSIPYGSTKVEYLESYNLNGPWIQTGLISNGLNIDVTASHHVGKSGDGNVVCGSQTGGVLYKICGNTSNSCGWLFQDEGVTEWRMLSFPNLGDIWNLKVNFQNLSVHMSSGEKSSTTYFNERYYELSDDLYFTLFGCGGKELNSVMRGNGATEQVRIYKFSANKDGIHNIINLIPSIDKTGTPCMFDLVTRKNFYNAGKGQFKCVRPNGLPSDYTPVEYLESSGTEYISIYDVNFVVGDDIEMSSELQITDLNGVRRSEGANSVYFFWGIMNDNKLYAGCGTGKWGSSSVLGDTNWHVFSNKNTASQQGFYVDDNLVYSGTKITSNHTPLTLQLWKCHNGSYYFDNRKKWWRLTLNGEVKHNLLPCLDQTGTPCMYDTVTQTPYYNAGTGDFLYPSPTSAVTYSMRRPQAEYAKMTDTGIRRLYHVPDDYEGSLEDYVIENGYKKLIETESPNEDGKYYDFRWVETNDNLTTEWFEIDPPQEEFIEENLDNLTE